jgi:DNA-binding transcriptional ArsR family regulator
MAQRRADAERIAAGLKLLSDATRIVILDELDRAPATVGETAQRVGIAQPTASAHLRQLREAGLIEAARDGQRTIYRVHRAQVERLIDQARKWMLAPSAPEPEAPPNQGDSSPLVIH